VPRQTKVDFDVTASGFPAPVLTLSGALPKGLSFTSGAGTATLSGTVNGTGTYPLVVTATSPAGTTHKSYQLRVTGPEVANGVSAQPGNKRATVKWAAPSLRGGLAVTGYVVTPYIGHVRMTPHTFHSTARHQVIGGLSNGHTYTFKVAVVNRLGVGPESLTTSQINSLGLRNVTNQSAPIKIGAPSAPPGVTAQSTPAQPGALVVRFGAAGGNGAPVSGYSAVCTSHNGGVTGFASGNGGARVLVVGGLTTGKTYACAVSATNKRGTGPAGTAPNATAG